MSLHSIVRKDKFSRQTMTWLFALPLALGVSLTSMAAQEVTEQPVQITKEATAEKLPEMRVGELSFQATSLRISRVTPNKYSTEDDVWATLTLTITNHGKEPIALNYKEKSASFVNEHGYSWRERNDLSGRAISGLAIETRNSASTDYVVDPGGQLSATIPLFLGLKPNQSTGTSFNFQAVFSSFKDMGEGRLKKIRSYPVSFMGLKKSSLSEATAQSAKDGASNVGLNLKDALGRFFSK